VDSLLVNIHSKPHVLAKYKFDDATLPRICPINDSIFLGAGVYKSEFQYVLFNAANDIMDCKVEIYNARYDWFNAPHKFLSNQGRFKKHPHKNQFVFSLNHSANIDFLEVADNKINVIKLLRQKNPLYKVIQNGEMSMVAPDANCIIGYIDISACNNYVYALYTDKKATASYSSDKILVYDWEGNLVKEYRLNREAYYITVNETLNKLFAAVRNEDGGWSITSYDMNTKNMIPISPGST
jgi:hypothetical protein